MTDQPLNVAVIIVTYNSSDVLPGCLASLPEGTRDVRLVEVVVADNASTDATVDIAERATGLPIRVVQLGRNAGYAAGINAGYESLRDKDLDAVLVLNPDCRTRSGSVAVLAKALRRPGCGIAVPRLENQDGSLQPSLRRQPSVSRALTEALIGGDRAGRIGELGELITDPVCYERAGTAAWATGAAMLISVAALRDTGPWDESFLLYGEETEFALRAGDRGWSLWYEPTAVFEHFGGESGVNPTLWALLTVNRVRLYRRRKGNLPGIGYFAAVTLGEGIRALAGRPTARAAMTALLRPSKRMRALPG